MAEASVDNYQIILPMNLVVNAVILTEFVKPSSGLDTEPEPSLIYYKTEPAKEGTNEEASDPEQSGNSEEKENTSENVQSTATGTILKLRHYENATKFEKNLPPVLTKQLVLLT